MPKKMSVKKILELDNSGMSGRDIAITLSTSRNSVAEVLSLARRLNLTWDNIKEKEEAEIYQLFFPDKFKTTMEYAPVDYEHVHSELKKVGVNLKLLWNEYLIDCKGTGKLPCGYTKYCEDYHKYIVKNNVTSHIDRKPAIITEVDWSGPTMKILNEDTGEIIPVYLFVATLPYSQYSYVEATLSMNEESWIKCHINMFNYFKGTTIRLVCDNLKTGVITHPKQGEIVLNNTYEALGEHYQIAIMPTNVRKPKEKASVEGTVGKIATAVIAKLRGNTYHNLVDLERDVLKATNDFNNSPFQKRAGSRRLVYEADELPLLRKLPNTPFEISHWDYGHTVGLNCHVTFKKNFYSVPFEYVKKSVDIKYTTSMVEIYHSSERIASHQRFPDYMTNKYSTDRSHLPDQFNQPEWNADRLINWARNIGPSTLVVVERILDSKKIKEQSFNSVLAVLRLSKKYSNERLENACRFALTITHSPRYRHISIILTNNQDVEEKKDNKTPTGGYLRGADYYGGKK